MRQSLVLSLAWVAFTTISCSIDSPRQAAPPAVAVAPPPAVEVVAAPPPPSAEEIELQRRVDLEVAATAAYLATRRRTGLVEAEIAELARVIVEESRRHGLETRLVLAVMHVESRFNSFAVSKVGALGLMQIMPATGEELAQHLGIPWHGPQTLFDPIVNTRLGVAYVSQLKQRYDHLATALAAYNWGPGHIDGRLRRGTPLPKTYPGRVFEAYATTVAFNRS